MSKKPKLTPKNSKFGTTFLIKVSLWNILIVSYSCVPLQNVLYSSHQFSPFFKDSKEEKVFHCHHPQSIIFLTGNSFILWVLARAIGNSHDTADQSRELYIKPDCSYIHLSSSWREEKLQERNVRVNMLERAYTYTSTWSCKDMSCILTPELYSSSKLILSSQIRSDILKNLKKRSRSSSQAYLNLIFPSSSQWSDVNLSSWSDQGWCSAPY